MYIDQHYLLAISPSPLSIPTILSSISTSISQNPFDRIGSSTLHFLKDPLMKLPLERPNEKKEKTKWEAFASKKKIEKRKKPFFIENEETKEKIHRYGAKSLRNQEIQSGIRVNGKTYSKLKREREERIKKNREQMERNKKNAEKKKQK